MSALTPPCADPALRVRRVRVFLRDNSCVLKLFHAANIAQNCPCDKAVPAAAARSRPRQIAAPAVAQAPAMVCFG